ncbi:L-rhamnose mutarotase [Alicyclobacillus mengziensis]|uniref:L-rhamnose mutarotase n=1 Tax=Alicyclobacillus mengziensis TaxID=2931921 RepID=A0A9X7W2F7_9BACL|nr:L-rhamnose mutarotase [Alicyclobacillus mengziensis]QSO49267.1 L-rhamnose mutarotase [Alicyclobacillus mengziensis]
MSLATKRNRLVLALNDRYTRHQAVYEELLAAFRQYGITTYSIFMDGTTLFSRWKKSSFLNQVNERVYMLPLYGHGTAYRLPRRVPLHLKLYVRSLSLTKTE